MITVYLCFLAGGAVIPLISFFLGFLSNEVDADADAGFDTGTGAGLNTDADISMDIGGDAGMDMTVDTDIGSGPAFQLQADTGSGIDLGLYPTSLMSLSALALIFGAVGGIMTLTGKGKVLTFVTAVIVGYVASVIVQTIIKSLKKIQTRNYGINENDLLMYDGTVIDTILPGQLGSVSFVTLQNVRVSYPARCDNREIKLETGRSVRVKEIQHGVFIVEPKNKYE